jgi:hypothetical protein
MAPLAERGAVYRVPGDSRHEKSLSEPIAGALADVFLPRTHSSFRIDDARVGPVHDCAAQRYRQ